MSHSTSTRWRPGFAVAAALILASRGMAQSPPATPPPNPDSPELKKQLDEVNRKNQDMQKQIDDLRLRLDQPPAAPPSKEPIPNQPDASPRDALDKAVAELGVSPKQTAPQSSDVFSFKAGSATVRLIDISLVADLAVGWSSENDKSLQTMQAGDHDPRKRGFTLQAAEIALAGAVDPYFNAQANINYAIDPITGDSKVELEEAFATSQSLPWGLQVKAGQYLTEFGILNSSHPHTWDFLDQPIVISRFFGGDGMRAPGGRIGWLIPVPWYSQIIAGVQNGNGETMVSFLANEETFNERAIGGRPFADPQVSGAGDFVYSGRFENSVDLSKETTIKFGVSGVVGPNATGGNSQIYGADFKLKWKASSNERGWPFVIWQSEIMARDYNAAAFAATSTLPAMSATTLHDWGFYTQALYGFTPGWAAGLRYEYATGSGDSIGGRDQDPFRDNRQRISPVITWNLSEFSRLRLQYNHDIADHLMDGHADSVFFGLEILFGAHPAHSY